MCEPQTLGLMSVRKGKRAGQSENACIVVEVRNPTTEVGDGRMVADLEMEDIAMVEEKHV